MKIWAKVTIKDKNKEVESVAKSLTNYLYGYGPIHDICRKYNINQNDRKLLDQYTANRVAGLLMLYFFDKYAEDTPEIYSFNIFILNFSSLYCLNFCPFVAIEKYTSFRKCIISLSLNWFFI